VIDSLAHSLDRMEGLVPLYALVGRIRLSSSETVVTAAEKVLAEIVAGYARPNLTAPQFQEMAIGPRDQRQADPLAEFSRVCREELRALGARENFPRTRKQQSPQ